MAIELIVMSREQGIVQNGILVNDLCFEAMLFNRVS